LADTVRKCIALIGAGHGGRWLFVLVLAVVVSVFEAVGTLLVFALLGLLVGSGEDTALPMIGDIRGLVPGMDQEQLTIAVGIAVAAFFILRGLVILAQSYVQYRVAENAGAVLSSRLLAGYLSMPYAFHLQRNSSELIRNAFESVKRFVREGLIPGIQLIARTAVVVAVVAVLLATSPTATLFAVAFLGPSLWLILRLVHPRVKRLGRIAQDMAKQNLQALQQSLHGLRDIVVLGREATFVDAYLRDRKEYARTQYLRKAAGEIPRVALETGVVLFIVAFLAAIMFTGGSLAEAVPVLGLFGYAAVRLMPELTQITKSLNSLKFVGPAVDNIYDDLEAIDRKRRPTSQDPLPLTRDIAFDQVSYTYPSATAPALTGVDLKIRRGESLGVVGPTGGGKSTFVDLLLGLLDPTEGAVRVDGHDIRDRLPGWQRNLGVVPQTVFLTDDTMRRNVALGVPDDEIDDDAIAEAIRLAQLEQFVASLPDGIDTFVGERGVRVSGGQRQRLAIARALYRRPDVIVFDEGTSALDNQTEAALMDALQGLREGRTLITVAHRLTTVEPCDRVVLIRDGRIVDSGTYDALAGRHTSLKLSTS
jgi:ATP-binding cassette, subfamily B, bacterial PglK